MRALDDFTDLRGIDQERAERATEWLVSHATEVGTAKGQMLHAEKMTKVAKSIEMLKSNQTSAPMREADALASERYAQAAEREQKAAIAYEVLRATKDAAEALIETWRSIEATKRGARV